jgi:hypothetical protein
VILPSSVTSDHFSDRRVPLCDRRRRFPCNSTRLGAPGRCGGDGGPVRTNRSEGRDNSKFRRCHQHISGGRHSCWFRCLRCGGNQRGGGRESFPSFEYGIGLLRRPGILYIRKTIIKTRVGLGFYRNNLCFRKLINVGPSPVS